MTGKRRVCAECFGPRSRYARSFFCAVCERNLFGKGYWAFIHNERTRNGMRHAGHA